MSNEKNVQTQNHWESIRSKDIFISGEVEIGRGTAIRRSEYVQIAIDHDNLAVVIRI